MSEQIDIAVDLGVVAPPLPEILSLRQFVEVAPQAPSQVIEGGVVPRVQDGPRRHEQEQ